MFDTMCWNSARMRLLFTRDTQATANWLDLTSFVLKLPLWHSSPCAQHGTPTEMTTKTCSAIEPHYAAWSWWDFRVWAVMISLSTEFLIHMSFNRQFYSPQVNESDVDDQDFGDYALDFMADSPATLESSLSPAELVPFQGCVIPPLTPQRYFSSEDSLVHSSTETGNPSAQDGALWKVIAQCQGTALGDSMEVNNQLHESLHRKQEEIDSLQERNLHLKQLASRAKHLASVLEKLMTVRGPHVREPVMPCCDKASLSPCKRQRLDETESSDSVEDMLRDISTRCNAVLHSAATGTRLQQESETVRMYGAFSGLQTSISKDSSVTADGAEPEDRVSSFRTSIREHCTIKTQVFPHGRAFTSRVQQGGYRFRWVPNHS
ncbi:multicilin isoform X1 [Siniperca chuatsi]|uniref:multicilin isoform X1 n=1 Tax=Siniperca chuatsi TaxID=119488 RepID=UPI001CE072ED|nr:multicilin isoform X1 [Siniperca chuatsi]XP_044051418.1 multicilin isoform X1 [Siniperca chuatsi]